MLKKISVGRSEFFFLILFFYDKIDVWWHLECISTLEEGYLTRFCQNNDPLDIKNYIWRQE